MLNNKLNSILVTSFLIFFSHNILATDLPNKVSINFPEDLYTHFKSSKRTEIPEVQAQFLNQGHEANALTGKLSTRGQSSLAEFSRKNFSFNIKNQNTKAEYKSFQSRDLIFSASPEDELLVKNSLSYLLLIETGLTVMPFDFSSVEINQKQQGLYLVTPAPGHYLMKDLNSEIVIRRRYNDFAEIKKTSKNMSNVDQKKYISLMSEIHKGLKKLKGQDLLNFLSERINLKNYMKWMAANYILRNGDYSDEVFFYGKIKNGKIFFDILPWDLDDTFSKEMHFQSVPYTINSYKAEDPSYQFIYNYESRLDQAISEDQLLLGLYIQTVEDLVNHLRPEVIEKIKNQLISELTPYLKDPEILKQGEFDAQKKPHSEGEVLENINSRIHFITKNIQDIKTELNTGKTVEDRVREIPTFVKKLAAFQLEMARKMTSNKEKSK